MQYFVEVVEYEGEKIERRIPCGSVERNAQKTDDGLNRNLNHDKYFTRVVSEE